MPASGAVANQGLAARPAPGRPLPPTGLELSEPLARRLGIAAGTPVAVTSYLERTVFAEAVVAGAQGAGEPPLVRLGRLLWTELGVRPGDSLTVEPVEVADARRVVLTPAFHLSRNLEARAAAQARDRRAIVWPDARLFLDVFGSGGGILLRVTGWGDGGPVRRVCADTEVEFAEPDADVGRGVVTFSEVGGLSEIVSRLRSLVELPLLRPGLYRALGVAPPRGVLLHGPPGNGKTLLTRAVAEDFGVRALKLSATDIVGTYSGETEAKLRSLFSDAAHHAPTLIAIDEIDVLTSSRNKLPSQGDIRATTQMLALMDGLKTVDGVVVLATTNRIEAVDEAFRRPGRFDEELFVGAPDARGRQEILAIHTREMPLTAKAEQALSQAAETRLAGFSGADLMHLVREIGLTAAERVGRGATGVELADTLADVELSVDVDDVEAGLSRIAPSALRSTAGQRPRVTWDEIVGLDEAKEQLRAAAEAALSGAAGADGVLLTGPSGNGKSLLAGALGHVLNANVVHIDGSTVFTQWLGESEAALRALFAKARQVAPAIVVIEHLDAIAPRRGDSEVGQAGRRVLAALLSSLDAAQAGRDVFVVGVTDREDLVDQALCRAGRLGTRIAISSPDERRRRAIAARILDLHVDDPAVTRIAAATQGGTAADVERNARQARRDASPP